MKTENRYLWIIVIVGVIMMCAFGGATPWYLTWRGIPEDLTNQQLLAEINTRTASVWVVLAACTSSVLVAIRRGVAQLTKELK
jgi:hypothetical protein